MKLAIERRQLPHDITVFELTGRIILGNNSHDLEEQLVEAIDENHRKFIIDLTQVDLLDSTGVGILVIAHSRLKKVGGKLRVAGANGVVEKILKMTSVDKLINFFPTVEAATAEY